MLPFWARSDMAIRSVEDVAAYRMCIGCGACAAMCPEENIELVDLEHDGIRPFKKNQQCQNCVKCVDVCPGYTLEHTQPGAGIDQRLRKTWGPVREIWEGYAADKDLRYHGSSGAAASALALFGLKSGTARGVVHIGPDPDTPWKSRTEVAHGFKELLNRTGSRYAPASPCDALRTVRESDEPVVFIGKPCDVAAVRRAQQMDPVLSERIVCLVSIFCAGTPSTNGTRELLRTLDVQPEHVKAFRFRGRGWPGHVAIQKRGERGLTDMISYKDSWHMLQRFRPLRCHLCPDGTGEFADIACGDPWYHEVTGEDPGRSLVIARTKTGQEYLRRAHEAGFIRLQKSGAYALTGSQPNLAQKRGALWGRLSSLSLLGIPTPRYKGFSLFGNWLGLDMAQKLRSVIGTLRRGLQRKYYRKRDLHEEKKLQD